jgi:RND family efflux transporter MFP subunit
MKFKLILSIIAIIIIGTLAFRFSQKKPVEEAITASEPFTVTTQTVNESRSYTQSADYPAIIVGDQQVTVTAGATGTITSLNVDLGTSIAQGQRLATIDITGTTSKPGENGFKDSQVRTLELAVESAEQVYKRAKDAYKESDTYANKKDKEIAKISMESAQASLQGALDGQIVTAPISGTIIDQPMSLGDAVTMGQTITTISKTGLTKIQFYITKEELPFIAKNTPITIHIDNEKIPGIITTIAPQADPTTKRFLVEAQPHDKQKLTIGSVFTVSFDMTRTAQSANSIILPLDSIIVGQNENYVFTIQDNIAKKMPVNIIEVFGETAEVTSAEFTPDMQIIIDGSKIIQDNDPITIKDA